MINFIEKPYPRNLLKRRKRIFGVGINDSDYYVFINDADGKIKTCPFFSRWRDMLDRCYSGRFTTYINCYVCDEWLTFSNFKRWMVKQDWKGKDLDKDIKFQGNNCYSPEFCIFIPHRINTLLLSRKRSKSDLPEGVCFDNSRGKFYSQVQGHGFVGRFDSVDEARNAYKKKKYEIIICEAEKQPEPIRTYLLSWDLDFKYR